MSAPWYDIAEPRPEAAFELYHENSKRSRSDGIAAPRTAIAPPDYGGLLVLALAEAAPHAPPPRAATLRLDAGPVPLRALSDLLAASCRPLHEADPVEAFVCLQSVETLPRCLAWYEAGPHRLRLLRRDAVMADVERALAAPDVLRRCGALIFLAANLDAATAVTGERGYRDALLATGRHLAAMETAAATAGLRLDDTVAFYDREVDALLFLDGVTRSVLAVVAVGSARG